MNPLPTLNFTCRPTLAVNNWAQAISIPLLPLLFYIEGKKGVAALPPLIPGEGTTKNRLTRTMTQCIQLKLLELRFVLKMGTSFLDYESATVEKQAEEHDEPRSQRATCFSTAAVPRKDRPRAPRATHWAPKTKAPPLEPGLERFLNGTIIGTFTLW